jgi:hypothetical protein
MKFLSRKFLLTIALLITLILLKIYDKIKDETFMVLTIVLYISYIFFNTIINITKIKTSFLELEVKEKENEEKDNS